MPRELIDDDVWAVVAEHGKFGDTFSDALRRALKIVRPETSKVTQTPNSGPGKGHRIAEHRLTRRIEGRDISLRFDNNDWKTWKLPASKNDKEEKIRKNPGVSEFLCVRLGQSHPPSGERRRMIVTARPRLLRLFLGSIKAPVPSSRPAIVPAAACGPCQIRRSRRDRSHAQPPLGGEHSEDPRFGTARARRQHADRTSWRTAQSRPYPLGG
jgi:hypothetical protein